VEHRRPGPTDGGVTAMNHNPIPLPQADPRADTTSAELPYWRNMLIGGMPGSGKSALVNLLAGHAALSASEDDVTDANSGAAGEA
jgi:ABC-type transport system involved in cytochrome bd biosynthesis fused ATPase/permease subunit